VPNATQQNLRLIDCFAELIVYTHYLAKGELSPAPAHDAAVDHYQQMISQAQTTARLIGAEGETFEQAFFPVCVWIDERILCSDWPDRDKWETTPLQKRFFDTTHGGEAFFTRLEALDDAARDIREIYACCLALGFEGRYYRSSDRDALDAIRQRTANAILPDEDNPFGDLLFPRSYVNEPGLKPADRRKSWRRISLVAVIAFVLPIALFAALITVFNQILDRDLAERFAIGPLKSLPQPATSLLKAIEHRAGPAEKPAGRADHSRPIEARHVVREGETLAGIAAATLGDPLHWVWLYRHNRTVLEKWAGMPGFPENRLPAGLTLAVNTVADVAPAAHPPRWVINLQSSVKLEDIAATTVKLVDAGYPAYLVHADVKGQRRLRLRVGFFETAKQAKAEGQKIQKALSLPEFWVTLAQPGEMLTGPHD